MKKTLQLFLIFLSPLLALSKGFVVKGSVEGVQTGTVSLAYVNQDRDDTTITAPVTGGTFTLEGKVNEPQLARFTVTEGWPYNISFFLENAAINIRMVKDAPEKTTITGSASQITYEKLEPGLNDFFAHARQIEAVHHNASVTGQALQSADSLWTAQQGQWIQTISNTIKANPDNYAALYFIKWLLFKPDNYDAIKSVFMKLSAAVRQGEEAKKFVADFEHLHKASVGQVAPEINGKDTSGRPVTLAGFKGKVILLDFWASYCGPCRQENRRMQTVYEKYHAAGFEIISLSLDDERRFWTAAIRADGMTWPQLSELRGGAGATGGVYDISDLPRNVLIDRTGKIYARDLHGDDLIHAVEGLLKK